MSAFFKLSVLFITVVITTILGEVLFLNSTIISQPFIKGGNFTIDLSQILALILVIGLFIILIKFIGVFREVIIHEIENKNNSEVAKLENDRMSLWRQNAEIIRGESQKNTDFFRLLDHCKTKTITTEKKECEKKGKITETNINEKQDIEFERFRELLNEFNLKATKNE